MAKDYYKILGVSRDSSDSEIKRAFRKLAFVHHPDKETGNEQKFKEINEAYNVLKSKEKRAAYDQFGSNFENASSGFGGGASGFGGFSNFSNIINDIFNGDFAGNMGGGFGSSQTSSRKNGSDIEASLQITQQQAYSGLIKNINIPVVIQCDTCKGSGSSDGKIDTCSTCHGRGVMQVQHGPFQVEQVCSTCHGTGKTIKNKCNTCHGSGLIRENKNIKIKIPKGISNGNRIRLAGYGNAGINGGASGDLYVYITIATDSDFIRQGSDLYQKKTIDVFTAILGGETKISTIDGKKLKLKIKPGTQNDQQYRLKGKGMPKLNTASYGDFYLRINVVIPKKLKLKQRKLLKEAQGIGL